MKKVLITGASGFVGKNLRHYLDKNEIANSAVSLRDENWKDELKEDISVVIHLAGKAHDLKKTSKPAEYYKINFELTKKLYDAFLESCAEKFIFISSVKAVTDKVEGVLTEETIPNPQTDYGKSKQMAEAYIQSKTLPIGKSYFILRPCMIHGPENKGNLNLLYKFVQKGIPYPLAAFNNKRSFLSVENLCFVIKEILLKEDLHSDSFQVADDEALSTSEVVTILSESIDKNPKLWHISASLIKFAARMGDLLKLPLNSEKLNKLTENYIVSNKKIKEKLNVALPISTRQGLMLTALSFKKTNIGKS